MATGAMLRVQQAGCQALHHAHTHAPAQQRLHTRSSPLAPPAPQVLSRSAVRVNRRRQICPAVGATAHKTESGRQRGQPCDALAQAEAAGVTQSTDEKVGYYTGDDGYVYCDNMKVMLR